VRDPRPLTTEPLSLDLANTEWMEGGARRDLLDTEEGTRVWLRAVEHPRAPADRAAQEALLAARAAIRGVVGHRDDRSARTALNAVLSHGWLVEELGSSGPTRILSVDDERWRVPWLAGQNLLELLRRDPGRARQCANPQCILQFYDTSRGGRRQWCSMALCGNREKAKRHYARVRPAAARASRADHG
jgi:predicted RNA-binding Zn ribbon-like protein